MSSNDALNDWIERYLEVDFNEKVLLDEIRDDKLKEDAIVRKIEEAKSSTTISDGLCGECQAFTSALKTYHEQKVDDWQDLGSLGSYTTPEMSAAAELGCRLCDFLLSELRSSRKLDDIQRVEQRLGFYDKDGPSTTGLIYIHSNGRFTLQLPGRHGAKYENRSRYGIGRLTTITYLQPINKSVERGQDKDHIRLCRAWVETCRLEHKACLTDRVFKPPRRLICVQDGLARMAETASMPSPPEYATLSYCWGPDTNFFKLTKATQQDMLQNIKLDDLPKTFVDAIEVVRSLGLHYIWIDALCIVQDPDEIQDWLEQSAIMRDIYGGGYVNIIATAAESVFQGLYHEFAENLEGVNVPLSAEQSCNIHVDQLYERETSYTHLASRAWCLQERLLASRNILFGADGVCWECRSHSASGNLPYGFEADGRLVLPIAQSWEWEEVAEAYSKANLSHGSDKLPALAGIARRQHEITGHEYLAGLWKKPYVFVPQLCWQVRDARPRPAWRAPTWSWLSVDGGVRCTRLNPGENDLRFAELVAHDIVHQGPDPFGQIKSAKLRIACSIMVECHLSKEAWTDAFREQPLVNLVLLAARRDRLGSAVLQQADLGCTFTFHPDCSEDEAFDEHRPVYMLFLYAHEPDKGGRRGPQSNDWRIEGTVVQAVPGGPSQFRRLGYFERMENRYSQTDDYANLCKAARQFGDATAAALSMERNPDPISTHKHIIELI